MAWWEGQLKRELQKLAPVEIERIVGESVQTVDREQFLSFLRALKREARRRGMLKEGQEV
jgi:hypothetical protein